MPGIQIGLNVHAANNTMKITQDTNNINNGHTKILLRLRLRLRRLRQVSNISTCVSNLNLQFNNRILQSKKTSVNNFFPSLMLSKLHTIQLLRQGLVALCIALWQKQSKNKSLESCVNLAIYTRHKSILYVTQLWMYGIPLIRVCGPNNIGCYREISVRYHS